MGINHAKVSLKSDGADETLIRPSDWNAPHIIEAGTIFNDLTVGDGTDNRAITINGEVRKYRDLKFQTSGSNRWIIRVGEGSPENGIGSDFYIKAYNEVGELLSTPVTIERSSGKVTTNIKCYPAKAYKTANQTIEALVPEIVTWEAETYDPEYAFDLTNNKYVAPVDGFYQVNVKVRVTDLADRTWIRLSIYKEGVEYSYHFIRAVGTGSQAVAFSDIVELADGEKIEIYAYAEDECVITSETTTSTVSIARLGV